jgi:hypothetical protein
MKTVAICPAYSHVNAELRYQLEQAQIPLRSYLHCSDLVRARSTLISLALKETDADVLLLVDSDIVPTIGAIDRLLRSAHLGEGGAVSGVYVTRDGRFAFCPRNPESCKVGVGGAVEATHAGLGFCAITRPSLERVAAGLKTTKCDDGIAWQPFCLPFLASNGAYYADDRSLWYRLAETGTTLYVQTNLFVGHRFENTFYPRSEVGNG